MGRADVDVPEDAERVHDPEVADNTRRGRREPPVDDDGDRGRSDEPVTEAAEALARPAVEPQEEDAGQHEMTDEVEDVHRLDQLGDAEERALEGLLPGEREAPLEVGDALSVRDRGGPIGLDETARRLVDP